MATGIHAKHFLPAIFSSAALALSLAANTWCQAIKFTTNLDGSDQTVNFGVFSRYGLEYVGTTDQGEILIRETCLQYDNVSFDAKWKTVKAFAIIAPVIGGILMVWTWIGPCFYVGSGFWKKGGVIFLVTCIFQGLTLLFLQSDACLNNPTINKLESEVGTDLLFDQECKRDWGYNCNIASVVMWFMAAVFMFVVPPAVRPPRPPPETQTVTYTQTTQTDGTTAVTTEVVKGTYMPDEKDNEEQALKESEKQNMKEELQVAAVSE